MMTRKPGGRNPLAVRIRGAGVLAGLALLAGAPPAGFARDDPYAGQAVFAEKSCLKCHPVYGKGGWGGPDLGRHQYYGTYLELSALMWNHLPKMSKTMRSQGVEFPRLEEQEMADLIAYLCLVRYMGEPGREFLGRNLLESKNCTGCHKFGGRGGDIGPDIGARKDYLSPLQLVESMWNHGPQMMGLFEKHGIRRPEFQRDEVVDLAAGIRSFMAPTLVPPPSFDLGEPERGRRLVQEKGCMDCHSFRGAGGGLGPDFDAIDHGISVTQWAGRMWNHGPKMWEIMKTRGIVVPVFAEGDLADILAFLYSLRMEDPPGDGDEGKRILREKGCLSCHSLAGQGGEVAPDLGTIGSLDTPVAMIASMWNHAPKMQAKLAEKDLKWPELTGGEMAHVFALLRNAPGPEGKNP